MTRPPRLTTVSLPLPWEAFGLPTPLGTSTTTLVNAVPGWAWDGTAPKLGIAYIDDAAGAFVTGWEVDHVVLLVPDLDDLITEMGVIGHAPRLKIEVKGRPTAFFRVGTVLEVVESPVRAPAIYGLALVTDEPLETVTLRWRSMGIEVGDIHPAIQPGRRIFSVGAVEAGLAVMSPDRNIG